MFDLEDLRTFVEVADAGGVLAGARRLGRIEVDRQPPAGRGWSRSSGLSCSHAPREARR